MSIPVLTDVIAPNSLWSATVRGRSMRRNRRGANVGGYQQINTLWSQSLRSWEFGSVPLSITTWKTLQGIYEVTDAGSYGFLLHDPQDNIVTVDHGRAIDYDSSDDTYRLVQRFTAPGGIQTHDRIVTRPDASTFQLFVNDVAEMSYTLDDDTGVILIPSDPFPDAITWSGRIYVPVHFVDDDIEWELVVAGPLDQRMFTGPRVMLEEIREA